jgi:hypothetical protein
MSKSQGDASSPPCTSLTVPLVVVVVVVVAALAVIIITLQMISLVCFFHRFW